MDEAGEKKQLRKLRLIELKKKEYRDKFVAAMMGTVEGREYAYWLLSLGGVAQNPFTGNALSTAFNCGQQNISQQIQAHIIENAPQQFLAMLGEKEKERLDAIRDTGTDDHTADE